MTGKDLLVAAITGLIGAGLLYVFDPDVEKHLDASKAKRLGKGESKEIKDKSFHITTETKELPAEANTEIKEEVVDDDVLVARVRAKMGHVIANASAVTVTAKNGYITLAGSLPKAEINALLETVLEMPDIVGVDDKFLIEENKEDNKQAELSQAATAKSGR